MKMAEKQPWKTRDDIKWLTIGKRKLGEGKFGKVFEGRLWLKGQKPKRVAVKVFNSDTAREYFFKPEIDEQSITHYEEAIAKLRRAGVPVLKTGFVKHEGNWIQVQQLHAISTGSKIADVRSPPDMRINLHFAHSCLTKG